MRVTLAVEGRNFSNCLNGTLVSVLGIVDIIKAGDLP